MNLIKTIESKVEWPERCVEEVNQARAHLQAEGLLDEPVMFVSRSMMIDVLYILLRGTSTPYYSVLKNNGLCHPEVKKGLSDNEVHLISGDGVVIVKDIKIVTEKKCHYCKNIFYLGEHRDALSGGRLLCASCYDKVFENVLGK